MLIRFLCAAWAALVLASCGGGSDGSGMDPTLTASPMDASARAKSGPMNASLLADPVSVVNTTTANDQILRAVGATQGGGYVVAWISTGQLLFMQAYDRAGARTGSELRIPLGIDAPTQVASRMAIEQSSLVVLRDGSVVVLYTITRDVAMPGGFTSTTTGVFFQIFSANGVQLVPETEVVSQPYAGPRGPSLGPPRLVALSDGGFAVASVLSHYSTGSPNRADVSLYWFNGQGQPLGSPVGVGSFNQVGAAVMQDLVADAQGGLVLSVLGTGATIYSMQYTAFRYGPDHVLSLTVVGPQSLPVLLLPLEDGYVLFTAAAGGGATMQMLDTQGNPVSAVATVASLPFAARELADGNFVVIWFAAGVYTAQLFADDGTSLGKAVPISSNGTAPAVAALAAPAFVAAWSAASASGDFDVYVQRFSEKLSAHRKACADSARDQGLKGKQRKAFVHACMGSQGD
ncbi:hypothetical protein JJB11_17810 [Ramlibacter ginsenosidimutans]|uniref:Lipoprotein n=1 Tax=Ramlibacter ginsenosidimutans TaxID=502333 RepID=A0A934TUZ6_9BURK|nr:hypothetical protein [Ramlibacter ginsenosidimutans]MBK6007959.1 hypothetical protein [Ramlibacter ginsenosidimutans]